ncbi:WD40 repeat domain-containing protein [Hyalangium rubrum]|uniref:WD40 repeat domain-containing protein n=1 Tax=Hyalangium rubrum TaxID=3103134 RepID=A0ABU5H2B2_9BACT|nr:WD40 repeat domain-containing protein [Hyalangium sp. s54d21]MDY7227456.1 WD40 repeat domain-containing protein [Hyalangium sp. s54d21]
MPDARTFYWMGREWVLEAGQPREMGNPGEGGVAASADGKVRAFAFCESLEIRDEKGQVRHHLELEPTVYPATEDSRGALRPAAQCSVALSPDGTFMVSWGSSDVRLWNPRGLKLIRQIRDYTQGVELSADGHSLVTWDEQNLRLWDPRTGKLLRTLRKHVTEVPVLWTEANAAWLVPMGRDASPQQRSLRRLDLKSGKATPLPELSFFTREARQTLDRSRVMLVSSSGASELRDAKSGKVLLALEDLQCVAGPSDLSPKGDAFALACEKGGLAVWELPPGSGP